MQHRFQRANLTPDCPAVDGGLGFGTTYTSLLFLGLIVAIVIYMTLSQSSSEPTEATR